MVRNMVEYMSGETPKQDRKDLTTMPRRGENIRKRADGRWEGRFVCERGMDGRAKYRSVYAHTYAEVKAYLIALKNNQTITNHASKNIVVTFGDAASKWLASCELRLKYSTVVKYKGLLQKHILPVYGKASLYMITEQSIFEFAIHKRETLSSNTVHIILVIIKAVLRYAVKQGWTTAQVPNIAMPSKAKRGKVKVLTLSERLRLEEYLTENMTLVKMGLYLCLYTGLRIGELCALKWENIDLSKGSLYVVATVQRIKNPDAASTQKTVLMTTDPKSSASYRTIPLPNQLVLLLKGFRTNNACYLLSGCETLIEPRTVQYWFKKFARELGLAYSNPHILRHTFATMCIESGFDAKTLSEILGHSSVEITLNKYVHSSEDRKRTQMALLFSGQDMGTDSGIMP